MEIKIKLLLSAKLDSIGGERTSTQKSYSQLLKAKEPFRFDPSAGGFYNLSDASCSLNDATSHSLQPRGARLSLVQAKAMTRIALQRGWTPETSAAYDGCSVEAPW